MTEELQRVRLDCGSQLYEYAVLALCGGTTVTNLMM